MFEISFSMDEDQPLRLDQSNGKLIELLLRLECYVRRVFGLPLTSNEFEFESTLALFSNRSDKQLTISRLVLTNYLYDSYLRLLISGRSNLVQSLDHVGTLTFVWSLNRAFRLDPSLQRSVDVRQFSEKLDNLRRASNIDILMNDSILFLERVLHGTSDDGVEPTTTAAVATDTDVERNDAETLNRLKTFYDVELENRLFDHSDHYDEAFVPSYRFCDSRVSVFNMSRHIGHTMRENIRSLYRYISQLIDDSLACPCVVIFNLFIRDNYRMYHSKSLRQSSFVSVRRSNGDEVKLSYMIVTNNFPRVNSWFKSINNQLVKKSGKNCIQHLDTFVRLMVTLSGKEETSSKSNSSLDVRRKRQPLKRLRRQDGTRSQSQRVCARITLSNLYRNVDDVHILSELCNTAYNVCKHVHVERTYEQLRSNDESATLIRLCLDCGKRV